MREKVAILGVDAGLSKGSAAIAVLASEDLDLVIGRDTQGARRPGEWAVFSKPWRTVDELLAAERVILEALRRFLVLGYTVRAFVERPVVARQRKATDEERASGKRIRRGPPPEAGLLQGRAVGWWQRAIAGLARDFPAIPHDPDGPLVDRVTLEERSSGEWRQTFGIPNNDASKAATRSKEWGRLLWPAHKWAAGDHETDSRLLALSQDPDALRWALARANRIAHGAEESGQRANLAAELLSAAVAKLAGGKRGTGKTSRWNAADIGAAIARVRRSRAGR